MRQGPVLSTSRSPRGAALAVFAAATLVGAVAATSCDPSARYRVLTTVFDQVPAPDATPEPRRPRRVRRELPNRVARAEETPTPAATASPQRPPIEQASERGWDATLRMLPRTISGGPDWMAALRQRIIVPRSRPEGGGIAPQPLFLDVELEPPDAVMKVVFPHSAHTQWLMCPNCHTAIFQMKKGADPITMTKIWQGEYCGRCHGKMAFDLGNCSRCHVNLAPPTPELVDSEVEKAAGAQVPSNAHWVERGKAIYRARCAICHGEQGDGNGPAAPQLYPKPRDFIPGKFKFRTTSGGSIPTDLDVFRTITAGVPGTSMPAWVALAVEDRWALVHYIKTFSERFTKEQPPPSITISEPPPITPELLAEGRQFFSDAGCVACHGDEGKGDGASAEGMTDDWTQPIRPFDFTSTKPMKSGPSPQDVYRTVMTGLTGTPMPSFGDVLEPQQAWAVVSFARSLRQPDVSADAASPVQDDGTSALRAEMADAANDPVANGPETVAAGKTLYDANCAVCHGENGDGNGPAAANLDPKPRDFIPGKFKFRTTPGGALPTDLDLFRTLTFGLPGTSMPSWVTLTPGERWALIHYVKSFSEAFAKDAPPAPLAIPERPATTPELLAEGRQLFADAGCSACHGDEGKGDGPSASDLKDDWGNPIRPFDFTGVKPMKSGPAPEDVYRTVMTGLTGTPMPSFGDVLEPHQSWAVVAHVLSLRPGGEPAPKEN